MDYLSEDLLFQIAKEILNCLIGNRLGQEYFINIQLLVFNWDTQNIFFAGKARTIRQELLPLLDHQLRYTFIFQLSIQLIFYIYWMVFCIFILRFINISSHLLPIWLCINISYYLQFNPFISISIHPSIYISNHRYLPNFLSIHYKS